MLKSEAIDRKIFTIDQLMRQLAMWRFKNKKLVFTNGCFDLIHPGHIDYLMKAADLGDALIIGLNSDVSVKKLKGEKRPLINEKGRATTLASLSFVDAVVLFEEDTPINLIRIIQPDFLVKGKDYKPEEIAGYDIVSAKGGKVITLDLIPGYSSSSLIQKLNS